MCIHFRTDIVSFKMVNNTSNMEKLELLVNFQQMILSCPYLNKCLFQHKSDFRKDLGTICTFHSATFGTDRKIL